MSEPGTPSLKTTAMRGTVLIAGAQGVRVFVNFALTVWLARLLSPDQFGVVAMAAPVTAFVLLIQNLGLDQAIIQSRTIDQRSLTTVFWLNVAATFCIAGILLLAGPWVGDFYQDARAGQYVMASSITVALIGPAFVHNALLNRDLRFGVLAIVDLINTAVTAIVTVLAAYQLRTFWALWIGTVAGAIATLLSAWIAQPWRPTGRPAVRGVGGLLGFGGNLTGFGLVNFFARNADNILIARSWGAVAVGNYDRAYKLMMFPIQNISGPLSRVTLPVLAKVRDNPDQFRRTFMLTLRGMMMAVAPGAAVAGATSERLIPFLLGEQWISAPDIFAWLAASALIQPFGNALGWLFIASHRSRAMFQWGLLASIAIVGAFLAGLPWGPVGVAMAYTLVVFLSLPLLIFWSTRTTAVRQRDVYSILLPTLAACGAAWIVTGMLAATSMPVAVVLAIGLVLGYALATAANMAFADGREIVGMASSAVTRLRFAR